MAEETEELEVPEVAELKAGTEVGGYLIEGRIGQGGMGVVYGAKHPRIGKRVAIKVLSPQYSANPSTVRRFELRGAGRQQIGIRTSSTCSRSASCRMAAATS